MFECTRLVFVRGFPFSGFLSDPVNLPGLAHFCEHMLFLGTEKVRAQFIYDFDIIMYLVLRIQCNSVAVKAKIKSRC